MKREKVLLAALCGCVLALCVFTGVAVHFWQESRETEAQLAAVREQNEQLETELDKLSTQLVQAEEEREAAEKERDYAQSRYEGISRRDNPIDQYFFSDKRSVGSSTIEMRIDAAFYCEAWKQELAHAVTWVKSVSEYEEDHQLLEDYQDLIEAQAEMAYDIALLRGAKDHAPGDERERNGQFILGTFGLTGSALSAAEAYRQGTLWLLDTYCYILDYHVSGYSFGFNEDFIVERYGTEDKAFPPLSQVLPDQP